MGKGRPRKPKARSRHSSKSRPKFESRRRPEFDTSDTGNAERLVYHFGHMLRYVETWDLFLYWTGTHWQRDPNGVRTSGLAKKTIELISEEVRDAPGNRRREALRRWKKSSRSAGKREAMIRLAKAEPEIQIDHTALDAHPMLLNCRNGTVDLVRGKLRPHDPADLLTKMAPVAWDPTAQNKRWTKFLEMVVPDESVRSFLQRFAGYSATGDVGERMFVVLHGGGRNGKSVFLRALQEALGPYAVAAAPGLLMSKTQEAHPTEVADLHAARLVTASEVRKGRVFDEEAVKRLTGNDRLKARRMHEDFWEFEPTFKLVLAANHKPRVRDASDSFWDRIALVGFDVRISDSRVDRKLPTKLRQELSGVFAWIVEGCRLWREKGLSPPEAVRAATKEYRESEDLIGRFIRERCVIDHFSLTLVPSSDLTRAVRRWCEENNLTYTFSERDLGERLIDLGCRRDRNAQQRGWVGVKLLQTTRSSTRGIESRLLQTARNREIKPN